MNCPCHQQPTVFKGGSWRCPVKFKQSQARYEAVKGKVRARRYEEANRHAIRIHTAGRWIRLPSVEAKRAVQAILARRRDALKGLATGA